MQNKQLMQNKQHSVIKSFIDYLREGVGGLKSFKKTIESFRDNSDRLRNDNFYIAIHELKPYIKLILGKSGNLEETISDRLKLNNNNSMIVYSMCKIHESENLRILKAIKSEELVDFERNHLFYDFIDKLVNYFNTMMNNNDILKKTNVILIPKSSSFFLHEFIKKLKENHNTKYQFIDDAVLKNSLRDVRLINDLPASMKPESIKSLKAAISSTTEINSIKREITKLTELSKSQYNADSIFQKINRLKQKIRELENKGLSIKKVFPSTFRKLVTNVFSLNNIDEEDISQKNILILDDIYTTGYTISQLANLIERFNPNTISAITCFSVHS